MTARLNQFISKHFNPPLFPQLNNKQIALTSQRITSLRVSCLNKYDAPQQLKKSKRPSPRSSRRLITISTAGGRWQDKWDCDYIVTLQELQLADLAEEGEKHSEVFVSLSIQKHTSFGFSVDGRIISSFKRKCSCCCLSYCTEIDTNFDVWVLPSGKDSELQLPEIGSSDQVIYVKPGSEADLDAVVQDTIRLTASTKDTCSEACEKREITWQFTDRQKSHDKRWSQLLEMKKRMQHKIQP